MTIFDSIKYPIDPSDPDLMDEIPMNIWKEYRKIYHAMSQEEFINEIETRSALKKLIYDWNDEE